MTRPDRPATAAVLLAIAFAWAANVGAIGVFDLLAIGSGVGKSWTLGGAGAALVSLAALGAVRRGQPWSKLAVVMLGTLPFSGFVLFISWRIAISAQQVAACEGGSVEMCEAAAKRKLKRGETDLAVELFGRGCALGSVECCFEAAALDRQAGRSAEALPRIAAACDAGHLLACETLGTMLKNGEGTLADPAGAAAPLERACDGGRANACETLRLLMQAPTR